VSNKHNRAAVRRARKALQREVRGARARWFKKRADEMGRGNPGFNPVKAREALSALMKGLGVAGPRRTMGSIRKPGGELTNSFEESAAALADHFRGQFDRPAEFDPAAIELLPSKPTNPLLGKAPSLSDIQYAVKKFKRGKSPGGDRITTDFLLALIESDAGLLLLHSAVLEFWHTRQVPRGWSQAALKLIPKSGDLKDPARWRPITLISVMGKLAASILTRRLAQHLEQVGVAETQNGFRAGRGCADGYFSLRTLVDKRFERGLGTYIVFADLIKSYQGL